MKRGTLDRLRGSPRKTASCPGICVRYTIDYLYWPTPTASACGDRIELCRGRSKRYSGRCPNCERPQRKLYAPPGDDLFLCRRCHNLAYSGIERLYRDLYSKVMGPVYAALDLMKWGGQAAPGSAHQQRLLADADAFATSGPEGWRVACLLLRAAGLSYRQIAACLPVSKSSVARYVAAGRYGIDSGRLYRERLRISRETHAQARLLWHYPWPIHEPEVMGIVPEGGELEHVSFEAALGDTGRCFDRLRERGRRLLSEGTPWVTRPRR